MVRIGLLIFLLAATGNFAFDLLSSLWQGDETVDARPGWDPDGGESEARPGWDPNG